ncbi:MAG: NACHT domain-containing protein, partial [Ktedonobacteraceae bacterium]
MSEDLPSNQRAIGSYIAQADRGSSATVNIYPGSPALKNQNRQRLLAKVQAFWIKGVLEQSLYGAAVIELGLHEQPDAVTNPWRLFVEQPDQPGHLLPLGTPIKQVYDNAAGELLILGEPGSGKTTLLLQLARDLLAHAEMEETDPVPVVFNLSSWAMKRQPIIEWLIEELNVRYQVPSKLGQFWVDADQVLPLLDGLDEVTPAYRTACIDAINTYRREHGLVPMVVCSRRSDYLTQPSQLVLHGAVVVQLLTPQQVDDYLSIAGEELAAVRGALRSDKVLQELAITPLMLSVLTLAYHGKPVEDLLSASSPAILRRQVFATYVERMLQRRGTHNRYTPQQTKHWLTWLARQLTQHNQTEFYLERMQMDWLSKRWSLWLYRCLAFGLICGLIGLLLSLLIGGLAIYHFGIQVYGLIGLITGVLLSREMAAIQPMTPIRWSLRSLVTTKHLRKGLGIGLVVGLIVGFAVDLPLLKDIGLIAGGADILGGALIGALIGVLSNVLIHGRTTEIQPAELVTWSWQNFMKSDHLRKGLGIGLVVGLVNLLIYGQIAEPLSALLYGLTYILLGLFFSTLLIGLFSGLSSQLLDDHKRVKPNEGLRRSARNSRLVGLAVGVLLGLVSGICFGLFVWLASH